MQTRYLRLTCHKIQKLRQILLCWIDTPVEFHYPDDLPGFNISIKTFQRETFDEKSEKEDNDSCENILGEKNKFDKLIVMDDVSGMPDKSNEFSYFLTVSRKIGNTCLCKSSTSFIHQNQFGK